MAVERLRIAAYTSNSTQGDTGIVIYDGDVAALIPMQRRYADQIVRDHHDGERLREALEHVEGYHQPQHNRCCDEHDKNVYGYIKSVLEA